MSSNADSAESRAPRPEPRRLLTKPNLVKAAAVLAVLLAALYLFRPGETSESNGTTYTVKRGDLPITIVEGGEAASLEPRRVKCEVKSREIKILKMVEEGYRITPEDIADKKVLVELDSSELEDRMLQQDIEFHTSKASLAKAIQDYEIQEEQNVGDIQAAEREAKFMAMDLQKYLGEAVANDLIQELHLRRAAEAAAKQALEAAAAARAAAEQEAASGQETPQPAPAAGPPSDAPLDPEKREALKALMAKGGELPPEALAALRKAEQGSREAPPAPAPEAPATGPGPDEAAKRAEETMAAFEEAVEAVWKLQSERASRNLTEARTRADETARAAQEAQAALEAAKAARERGEDGPDVLELEKSASAAAAAAEAATAEAARAADAMAKACAAVHVRGVYVDGQVLGPEGVRKLAD
ncbi:MAG: hypothetical protein JXR94_09345, partial [Candidatus Hydrogenedentes bacterium]|nr:hypothetical protein [Candidatus Hydrogenedentota bacterium]